MKNQQVITLSSIISLIVFTIIFLSSMAQASESVNDSEQKNEIETILQDENDANTSPSSSELSLSLNEKLHWFFSVEQPDFIDDPYEIKDYDNYRATFGIHIVL